MATQHCSLNTEAPNKQKNSHANGPGPQIFNVQKRGGRQSTAAQHQALGKKLKSKWTFFRAFLVTTKRWQRAEVRQGLKRTHNQNGSKVSFIEFRHPRQPLHPPTRLVLHSSAPHLGPVCVAFVLHPPPTLTQGHAACHAKHPTIHSTVDTSHFQHVRTLSDFTKKGEECRV